jgi:2-keto-4-pentenoate hydratase/2-oxohepta-3-ene-1,7-dioic acid hydratase in catechol pathway
MRLCRFAAAGAVHDGEMVGDTVHSLLPTGERGRSFGLDEVTLLAPCRPTKIVAVGVNYRAHAVEFGKPVPEEPLLFLKPPSALLGPGGEIRLPRMSSLIHHEAELAAVIGRRAHAVTPDDARRAILGFTCFNDVTARDLQRKDGQFTRGKGFDTFAPVGPFVDTEADPRDLRLVCRVNGEVRQDGRTSDMVFGVYDLVSFISRVMTLEPGDIVTTGTPPGVGPLLPGDRVEVEIEGLGILINTCAAEK